MFDIGWSELLVIGVVALIAIGPKELPGVLRSVGQWMGKIRRMASEFQGQFQEAMREAEMADLKKQVDEAHATKCHLDLRQSAGDSSESRLRAAFATEPAASAAACCKQRDNHRSRSDRAGADGHRRLAGTHVAAAEVPVAPAESVGTKPGGSA